MIRKLLVIAAVLGICVFYLSGCKKSPSKAEPQQQVKTTAEYEAEAKEQISEKNMDKELEQIEKSVEEDINQEQQEQ